MPALIVRIGLPYLVEEIIEHIVVVGLPLGILVRGNGNIEN